MQPALVFCVPVALDVASFSLPVVAGGFVTQRSLYRYVVPLFDLWYALSVPVRRAEARATPQTSAKERNSRSRPGATVAEGRATMRVDDGSRVSDEN